MPLTSPSTSAAFQEAGLTRLGAHREVGVCGVCGRWLHRRAPLRRLVGTSRAAVMRAPIHDWPLAGPVAAGAWTATCPEGCRHDNMQAPSREAMLMASRVGARMEA